jgi:hypothetical protein
MGARMIENGQVKVVVIKSGNEKIEIPVWIRFCMGLPEYSGNVKNKYYH